MNILRMKSKSLIGDGDQNSSKIPNMAMQPSNIIQGLSRPDFYTHLMQLRKLMAEKRMSIWMESESSPESSTEPTPDTRFLFSLLESLYDEKVNDTAKCHLLILIEEHFDAFVTSASVASQLVQSLMEASNPSQDRRSSTLPNYYGYLYQCITAIIIRFNLLQTESDICERFIQTLLDLLCVVRAGGQHTRFRALVSLEHLEQRYPTFLMWKLEQLVQVCSADFTVLFEHCLRLFSLVLRNAVDYCVMCEGKWNPDLFNLRTESLWHCQVDFLEIERLRRFDVACSIKRCLTDSDGQLLQHLHYCLDRMKYLSIWSLVAIFDNLSRVVARFDNMATSLFKTVTLRTMPMNMPRLLFSMMQFRILFSDVLYKEHTSSLLHTCLSHMNNARNTIPHRLLTSHWLAQNVAIMETERQSVNTRVMTPSIFDPLDVKYAKMLFLNSFLPVDDQASAVLLLTNIICIRKLSQYSGPGRVTAALFQILFQLYLKRHETALANDIQSLMMGITKENADFVPYTLDFVDSIQAVQLDSPIPKRCAIELSDWACDSLPDVIDDAASLHFMRILAQAVRQKEVDAAPVVEVMNQILSDTALCADGDWTKGNGLLDICRSLLEHRSDLATGELFHGIGEVLSATSLRFNNLDVRQRGELYYSMLLLLNGQRLQQLLAGTHSQPTGEVLLKKTDGYPVLPEVRFIEWPVFEVRNVPVWTLAADNRRDRLWTAQDSVSLQTYLAFVKEHADTLPLVLALSRSPEAKQLGVLFGLEFSLSCDDPEVSVSVETDCCVALSENGGLDLRVEVANLQSNTLEVTVNASFTDHNGLPSLGQSLPVRLEMKDLIQPLPIATKQAMRLVANEMRCSSEFFQSFMTLQLNSDQKEELLADLDHLLVDDGHYCGLLLPDSHVVVDMEEKEGGLYFISILSDRSSVLKHFYQYLVGCVEMQS